MTTSQVVAAGGWLLVLFTFLYLGTQTYLFYVFNYPTFFNGSEKAMLAAFVAGGNHLRIALVFESLLPLLLLPASFSIYYALRENSEPSMRMSLAFAMLAIFSLMLCLMRWPTINWYLAMFYQHANASQQAMTSAILSGFNAYFGVLIGKVLSQFCAVVWFFCISLAMLRSRDFPKWMAYIGLFVSLYLLIALLANFPILSTGVATLFNICAPVEAIWLLILGVGLIGYGR